MGVSNCFMVRLYRRNVPSIVDLDKNSWLGAHRHRSESTTVTSARWTLHWSSLYICDSLTQMRTAPRLIREVSLCGRWWLMQKLSQRTENKWQLQIGHLYSNPSPRLRDHLGRNGRTILRDKVCTHKPTEVALMQPAITSAISSACTCLLSHPTF